MIWKETSAIDCISVVRFSFLFSRVNMHPAQFLKSIYLGDRACKAVLIFSWRKQVAIHVDVVSRLRPGTENWDFYTDGDIVDGHLVFNEVSNCIFDPSGLLPNDFINELAVSALNNGGDGLPRFLFQLSIGSVDDDGNLREVLIKIEAATMHLEDPSRPGVEIVDG